MKTAVFLDRDNTLIHNDGDLGDPQQVKLIKGAASAIASLRGLGYKIVVVSNQGGVARGVFTEKEVDQVNQRVGELVKATTGATIDRFYYCPYHPQGKVKKYCREHPWRKPQPGMLLQAAKDLELDLNNSWIVGDQLRDVQAGLAVDVRAILLREDDQAASSAGKQDETKKPEEHEQAISPSDYWVTPSLIEAVKIIAQQRHSDASSAADTPSDQPDGKSGPIESIKKDKRKKAKAKPAAAAPSADPAPPPTRVRPFRPWMIPPDDDTQDSTGQEAVSKVPPVATQERSENASSSEEPLPPTELTDGIETTSAGPGSVPIDQTLRQILQELRNHRAVDTDFSYQDTIAIVLQMLAVVCMLGALWMGSNNLDLFVRWAVVGLAVQLATIAMLMFRK